MKHGDEVVKYNGWIKVYKRNVNGREYDILKNYSAVAGLIYNENKDVLLVKQHRPALMRDTWEIPAGCLDIEGEDPLDCLMREITEETGLDLSGMKSELISRYKPIVGLSEADIHLYAICLPGSSRPLKSLHDVDVTGAEWFSFEDLKDMVQKGIVCDGKTHMSYFWLNTKS